MIANLIDRFRTLSQRQQILAVTTVAGIVTVLLACVWVLFLRVPYATLFTGLRTADAATIVADLERKKIAYDLSDGGTTISVPSDVADRVRLGVMTDDLPLKGTVGFELFDKSDMGLTDFAQKINYQRALQGELERTIASLDGVESARVHLSLGEERIFRDDTVPPKASAMIRMRASSVLSADQARGIQRLIAASVPNLETGNVVVLDARGALINTAPSPTSDEDTNSAPQAEARRGLAHYFAGRIRQALDTAFPLNSMNVDVALIDNTIKADGTAPADIGSNDLDPQLRAFALYVTVKPVLALDSAARDTINRLLVSSVGFDAAKNDVVIFAVPDYESAPRPSNAQLPRTVSFDEAAASASSGTGSSLFLAIGIVAVVGVTPILLLRARRPRRLSAEARLALASRFHELLDEEGQNA